MTPVAPNSVMHEQEVTGSMPLAKEANNSGFAGLLHKPSRLLAGYMFGVLDLDLAQTAMLNSWFDEINKADLTNKLIPAWANIPELWDVAGVKLKNPSKSRLCVHIIKPVRENSEDARALWATVYPLMDNVLFEAPDTTPPNEAGYITTFYRLYARTIYDLMYLHQICEKHPEVYTNYTDCLGAAGTEQDNQHAEDYKLIRYTIESSVVFNMWDSNIPSSH